MVEILDQPVFFGKAPVISEPLIQTRNQAAG
jgi:hypothetical protein